MKALSYISGDEVVCDGNDAYDLLIVMSGEVQASTPVTASLAFCWP